MMCLYTLSERPYNLQVAGTREEVPFEERRSWIISDSHSPLFRFYSNAQFLRMIYFLHHRVSQNLSVLIELMLGISNPEHGCGKSITFTICTTQKVLFSTTMLQI